MRFKFIHAERANYPVRVMCRVLRVSTSGYYAQMKRAPSKRQCEDGKLKLRIQAIHAHSRGTYGRERVRRQLDGENVEVGKQRVARLMREMGLQGLTGRGEARRSVPRAAVPKPVTLCRASRKPRPKRRSAPYPCSLTMAARTLQCRDALQDVICLRSVTIAVRGRSPVSGTKTSVHRSPSTCGQSVQDDFKEPRANLNVELVWRVLPSCSGA